MSAEKPAPNSDSAESAPAVKRGSPLRLTILLVILAAVVGALGYDYFVAKPAVAAAMNRLQTLIDERHQLGVDEGHLPHSEDVQKAVGFAPTRTEKKGKNTIEWYCWWGKTPLLSERRRYLWVKYEGNDPQHVSTFDFDNKPEDENIFTGPAVDPNAPLPIPGNMGHSSDSPTSAPSKSQDQPAADKPPSETPDAEKPDAEKPAAPTGGTNE